MDQRRPRPKLKPTRPALDKRKLYTWEGPFENWARAWVAKNFWKVQHHCMTREDALQECALIFARCIETYKDRVDNPAWMMSLFQMAVRNDWITFAQKDTQHRGLNWLPTQGDVSDLRELGKLPIQRIEITQSEGPLLAALSGASEELRTVLGIIFSSPAEVLDVLLSPRSPHKLNLALCRLCGIKTKVDVVSELRALLT